MFRLRGIKNFPSMIMYYTFMAKKHPVSLHQSDLVDVLAMADRLGERPPTVIIGVEPKVIDYSLELTPEVAAKIPQIIDLVFAELNQ